MIPYDVGKLLDSVSHPATAYTLSIRDVVLGDFKPVQLDPVKVTVVMPAEWLLMNSKGEE